MDMLLKRVHENKYYGHVLIIRVWLGHEIRPGDSQLSSPDPKAELCDFSSNVQVTAN
jgi:hypothetical protein